MADFSAACLLFLRLNVVSDNISLLSIIFLGLWHDYVELIFPVLYEVKRVVHVQRTVASHC